MATMPNRGEVWLVDLGMIAEIRLVATFSESRRTAVCLRVGRPEPRSVGDWVCTVQGKGLRLWQGPTEFFGVGSWHALMLALRFLREMLDHEIGKGTTFTWEDEDRAISIDDLFVIGEIKEPTDN